MHTTTVAEELMGVTVALRRVIRRRLRATLPGPRLTSGQVELLRLVESRPDIGVAAAARALHLAGNSVSTQVNQLVAAGLLHREADPADRRAVRLRLTEAARARLTTWRAARGQPAAAAWERLPETDRTAITAALPALRRLLDQLEHQEGP